MTGINVAAIIAIIDQIYWAIVIIAGLIGTIFVFRGLILIKYAVQMGGMNSMGTRSFYSEAMMQIAAGMFLWYFVAFINGLSQEITGTQFAWDDPALDSGYLVGQLVIKIIKLMGVWLMLKGIMALPDRDQGGFSPFIKHMIFGLLAISIVPLGNEIQYFFGINPIAFFVPGNSPAQF